MSEVSTLTLLVGLSLFLLLPALGFCLLRLDPVREVWAQGKQTMSERPVRGIDALFIGSFLLVLFLFTALAKLAMALSPEVVPAEALEASILGSAEGQQLFVVATHLVIITLCFLSPACLQAGPEKTYGLWPPADRGRTMRRAFAILFLSLPLVFGSVVLSQWIGGFFLEEGEELAAQDAVKNARQASGTLVVLLMSVVTVVTAPLWEELTFRGVILPYFCRLQGTVAGLCTVGFFFGAFHLHLPVLLPLSILGIALGAAYVYTGSILAPIVMHAVFNAGNLIAMKSGLG